MVTAAACAPLCPPPTRESDARRPARQSAQGAPLAPRLGFPPWNPPFRGAPQPRNPQGGKPIPPRLLLRFAPRRRGAPGGLRAGPGPRPGCARALCTPSPCAMTHGPASESPRPPPGAPCSASRLRARRLARGLRAALLQVGESHESRVARAARTARTAAAKKETQPVLELGGDAARQPLPSRAQGTDSLRARTSAPRRCPSRAPPRYAPPRCSRSPPAPRRPTRTRGQKLASGSASTTVHLASGLERPQAENRAGEIPPKYDEARWASVSTSRQSHCCSRRCTYDAWRRLV